MAHFCKSIFSLGRPKPTLCQVASASLQPWLTHTIAQSLFHCSFSCPEGSGLASNGAFPTLYPHVHKLKDAHGASLIIIYSFVINIQDC